MSEYAAIVGVILFGIIGVFQLGRHLGWRRGWRDGLDFWDDQFGGHMRHLEALVRSEDERRAATRPDSPKGPK